MYIYIYGERDIYIYRERERERERCVSSFICFVHVYIAFHVLKSYSIFCVFFLQMHSQSAPRHLLINFGSHIVANSTESTSVATVSKTQFSHTNRSGFYV